MDLAPKPQADSETQIFYRALLARDRRFDGRFFVGVRTTSIYCRPICPARHPLLKNVRFFPTAAAAEESGFRPCRRCRPESAPGTPAWIGSASTVARALRLLRHGDAAQNLDALAARLGVGARRLRQLFVKHLGASPQAVLRVQRLDFARRLIDETALPMAQIAHHAGFSSIRRFNQAVKDRFGQSPSRLRNPQRPLFETRTDELVLHLPYRPPYAWGPLLTFLAGRAISGVEFIDESFYARTLTLGPATGWLEVRPTAGEDSLTLRLCLPRLSAGNLLMDAVEQTRTLFDLEADALRIAEHLSTDPMLAPLIAAEPGLRVPGGWNGFELAVRAILGQQVSVKGATTLCGRLVRAFGQPLSAPSARYPALTHTFPSPAVLATADIASIGIPKARAHALNQLAAQVHSGALVLHGTADGAKTVQDLQSISGIGPWTAQYIAMRVLRDPDAFPSTDLVLQRLRPSASKELGENWRPFRAYAAMYLWRSAATAAQGVQK